VVLRTAGGGKLLDCIAQVYGLEVARNMLPLDDADVKGTGESFIKVSGMTCTPAVNRSGRDYLSFFLNRRWVQSRLLSWAVEEAYHGLLPAGKHPVVVINIAIPPGEVDVNIHPTKTAVKFRDERLVAMKVQRAVRRALLQQMPVHRMEEPSATYSPPPPGMQALFGTSQQEGGGLTFTSASTPQTVLPVLRVLGQLSCSYIVAEGPDGLYLIDQHAAHERIYFDRAILQMSQRRMEMQGLLEPSPFEVSPKQHQALKSCYQDLSRYGFSLEPFGDRTYLVRSVPALLHDKDWKAVASELLDFIDELGSGTWEEKLAMSVACHGAVRAGQALSFDEMREIIRQLEKCAAPHTCPHGRPTLVRFGREQLRKEFGRT
jgi:DNA mismatch repair protein MutL